MDITQHHVSLQVEEVVLLDTNSTIIVSPDDMSRKNMTWDIAGDSPLPCY
jgi:hypothetical protein